MDAVIELLDPPPTQRSGALRQGRSGAICFARARDSAEFLERLFLPPAPARSAASDEFEAAGARWRRHLPLERIGLVSDTPALLGQLNAQDNIGLLEGQCGSGRDFWRAVEAALAETGVLAAADWSAPAAALPWRARVEINFLQAWLREPECMVFAHLFDGDEGAALLHLPQLYRQRYPLRAICHVRLRGAVPAALEVTDVIELA